MAITTLATTMSVSWQSLSSSLEWLSSPSSWTISWKSLCSIREWAKRTMRQRLSRSGLESWPSTTKVYRSPTLWFPSLRTSSNTTGTETETLQWNSLPISATSKSYPRKSALKSIRTFCSGTSCTCSSLFSFWRRISPLNLLRKATARTLLQGS